MREISLIISEKLYFELRRHLLPPRARSEEAAFLFAQWNRDNFLTVEHYLVPPHEFDYRSRYHIELGDECRAKTIKRAHDLQASIIELHSHLTLSPARFSASDWDGFDQYVPHVRWRLKGAPYAAIVLSYSSMDSVAWISTSPVPDATLRIELPSQTITPNGFCGGSYVDERPSF